VIKKVIFGAAVLVAVGIFVGPVAANAAYTPSTGTVSGSLTPGSTDTISFPGGTFDPSDEVTFTISGAGAVTVGMFKANTASGSVHADGSGGASDTITLPTDATGSYSITAAGVPSGRIGVATITIAGTGGSGSSSASGSGSAGGGSGLADTGSNISMLVIWAGVGAVGLGIAFIIVLTIVRRQRLGNHI
jgi:hypothetical protein